mmetsp:Transcript_34913/g.98502  ORF Transcript_34913/g.98502 Transcript_34913/m.98502 type:complete len:209 (-) Transcript_34913:2381-3007(-)
MARAWMSPRRPTSVSLTGPFASNSAIGSFSTMAVHFANSLARSTWPPRSISPDTIGATSDPLDDRDKSLFESMWVITSSCNISKYSLAVVHWGGTESKKLNSTGMRAAAHAFPGSPTRAHVPTRRSFRLPAITMRSMSSCDESRQSRRNFSTPGKWTRWSRYSGRELNVAKRRRDAFRTMLPSSSLRLPRVRSTEPWITARSCRTRRE